MQLAREVPAHRQRAIHRIDEVQAGQLNFMRLRIQVLQSVPSEEQASAGLKAITTTTSTTSTIVQTLPPIITPLLWILVILSSFSFLSLILLMEMEIGVG